MPKTNISYHQIADIDLFSLVKKDDNKAFEELYNRHWCALVESASKRLQIRQKAEDIVQNIFVDLYQRRYSIELTFSLKSYLTRALKFKILNEYRSSSIRSSYSESLFLNAHCKNDFSNEMEAKELNQSIERTLRQLPEKCQNVFVLSRKENLSNKDIATGLNISVSTVEKHISKALKSLRTNLRMTDAVCYSRVI